MYIESVQLKNFRNYESLELDLSPGTNIFYGNNAQGKTEYPGSDLFMRNNQVT